MSKLSILKKLIGLAEKEGLSEADKLAAKAARQEALEHALSDVPAVNKSAAESAKAFEELGPNFELIGAPKSEIASGVQDFTLKGKPYTGNVPVSTIDPELIKKYKALQTTGSRGLEKVTPVVDELPKEFKLPEVSKSKGLQTLANEAEQVGMRDVTPKIAGELPGEVIKDSSDIAAKGLKKYPLAEAIPGIAGAGLATAAMALGNNGGGDKLPPESFGTGGLYNLPGFPSKEDKFQPNDLLLSPSLTAKEIQEQAPKKEEITEEKPEPVKAVSAAPKVEASKEEPKKEEQTKEEAPKSETQDLANLLSKESSNEPNEFEEAQKRRDLIQLANRLGAAGELLGSSISGTAPIAQQLFKENAAAAEKLPQDVKEKIAMQEHDPNSAMSQNYREFLKRYGVEIPENITASQIKQTLLPAIEKEKLQKDKLQEQRDIKEMTLAQQKELAKARSEEMALRRHEMDQRFQESMQLRRDIQNERTQATADNLAKRQLMMAKDKAIAGGGMSANRNRNALVAASRMFTMNGIDSKDISDEAVNKLSDEQLNKIPPQMVAEMVVDLNAMLTPAGVPPQSTFKKIMPKTAKMDYANLTQYMTGEIQPANAASFNRMMLKTAARVHKDAKQQNIELGKKYFSGTENIKERLPDDYADAVRTVLGIEPEELSIKPEKEISLSTAEKKQTLDFAKQHGMSYGQAEQIVLNRKRQMQAEKNGK